MSVFRFYSSCLRFAAVLVVFLTAQHANADAPTADIDPSRIDPGRLPSRTVIDPRRLPNQRWSRDSIDPGRITLDPLRFQNIDPGRSYVPVIPPRWDEPRRLYVPQMGLSPLDSSRPTINRYDPGAVAAPRARITQPPLAPIDPGRATKPTLTLPQIDPGALPRQGPQNELRPQRSTILRSRSGSNNALPTYRETRPRGSRSNALAW